MKGLIEQIGALSLDGRAFKFDTDERLKNAIQEVLLEKHKDITLPTLSTEFANEDQRKKLDTVRGRLIDDLGYCKHCAAIAMRRAQAPDSRAK